MSGRTSATAPAGSSAGPVRTWLDAPYAVRTVLIGVFVNRLGGFLQVYLVLYLTDRGYSAQQAGLALGLYGAGSVLGLLAGGWMSDRVGARRTILTSMLGSAALIPALLVSSAEAGRIAVVYVVATGVGAFSQAYRPAAASVLSQLAPEERQVMIFAMFRFAVNLGSTGAPLVGLALVAISYDFLFWGEATVALVFALVAAATLPTSIDAPAVGRGRRDPGTDRGHRSRFVAHRRFLLFLVAMLAFSLIYVQYLATLPLAVRAHGMSNAVYATLVAVNGLVVVAFELLVTKVVQHWPARFTVVAGLLLTAGGISLYAAPLGTGGLIVATLIWSFGETVGAPTMSAYPARMAPPALRGRYLGLANGVFGLGAALGPMLGVAVWNRLGDGLWLGCGAVGLLAALAAAASMREAPVTPARSAGAG